MGHCRGTDPDGIAPLHQAREVTHHLGSVGGRESLGPLGAAIEHDGDVGLDHSCVDHRLQPQPVGPGDQARPDEPDPQHDVDTTRDGHMVRYGRGERPRSMGVLAPPQGVDEAGGDDDQHGDTVPFAPTDRCRSAAADGELRLGYGLDEDPRVGGVVGRISSAL